MSSNRFIQLSSGEILESTKSDYDGTRSNRVMKHMEASGVHPLCHAPFVNLDFSPSGTVQPCNHWHSTCIQVDEDFSILKAWRGQKMQAIRKSMLEYKLDRDSCRHCVRQIELGLYREVFAQCQFDKHPTDHEDPSYPKRMIFRLTNTCNLACIMCDADTSSRVRSEFEKLPPLRPSYGKRFFEELREILPHLEHVEFYGGEPFLVQEHLQILELISELRAKCTIYVNTNCSILTERVKTYLKTLNFRTIAISMDAVNPDLHFKIRTGLKGELFARNLQWYIELAKERNINLLFNVTEHRKNWFEIPEIFRFAERKRIYIHVNTCIHPVNVTLYTLPTGQLAYVLDFVRDQRAKLLHEFPDFYNLSSYDYFLSLIENELKGRLSNWTPVPQPPTPLSDGLLGIPIPGKGSFEKAEAFAKEVARLDLLDSETAYRFLDCWQQDPHIYSAPGWSGIPSLLRNKRAQLEGIYR